MQSIPAPDALPSDAARKLAGDGLIDFRCDTGLHVLIGSYDDRMVIDKAGQAPLVLDKQAPGGTYDYMGGGWGAERRGDTVKLDRTEERREGKECGRACRSRRSKDHKRKNQTSKQEN